MKLNKEQKRAGFFEFAVGVPLNILLFCALYFWLLPDYRGLDTTISRIAFALECSALPAATLLFSLWNVAIGRGTSKAIDPLKGLESRTLQINIRFLQSTLEQTVLFSVSAASLSAFLEPPTIKVVPAFAIMFVINRFLFWIGYLRDPLLRGLGLSGTLYPITFMTLAALGHAILSIYGGG